MDMNESAEGRRAAYENDPSEQLRTQIADAQSLEGLRDCLMNSSVVVRSSNGEITFTKDYLAQLFEGLEEALTAGDAERAMHIAGRNFTSTLGLVAKVSELTDRRIRDAMQNRGIQPPQFATVPRKERNPVQEYSLVELAAASAGSPDNLASLLEEKVSLIKKADGSQYYKPGQITQIIDEAYAASGNPLKQKEVLDRLTRQHSIRRHAYRVFGL